VTRRALFIANPVARGLPPSGKLEMAAAWLESRGWGTAFERTTGKGNATELSRGAAEWGYDVVVGCGGDGTINEIANGLCGSETALAVIRGGTANVWAKEIGVPRDPLSAVRLVCDGGRRRMDLGVVEGEAGEPSRAFLLMAGVGLDGYVVSRVPEGSKRRLGAASYVWYGVREALRFRPRPTSLLIDGERVDADLLWLLAANTRSYGGVIKVAREAVADDGLLDVYLFEGRGLRDLVAHGLRILRRKQESGPGVIYRKAARIEISSSAELECQVDGESLEFAPRAIRVERRALAVMLPLGYGGSLFSGGGLSE
jgi:YegS/Rv2252/BmrU family lipid kinase